MPVRILERGGVLIASIQAALSDADLAALQDDLAQRVGRLRTRGVGQQGGRHGIAVVARDQGPGIADLELAMRDGFSTGNSLGLGLPGAKRLMDEFALTSAPNAGTTISMKKWLR